MKALEKIWMDLMIVAPGTFAGILEGTDYSG